MAYISIRHALALVLAVYCLLIVTVGAADDSAELKLTNFVLDLKHKDGDAMQYQLTFPETLKEPLTVRPGDEINIGFHLTRVPIGKSNGKPVRAHQAFIAFRPVHREASPDGDLVQHFESTPNGKHRINLIINRFAKYFSRQPGDFNVEILLGVFGNTKPIRYALGVFHMDFPPVDPTDRKVIEDKVRREKQRASEGPPDEEFMALPEIEHKIRPDEKMPPLFFSLSYSAAVLSPWLVLLTLWKLIGVNPTNLPNTPIATLAHGAFISCLVAFIILYYLYWTKLRLLDTVTYGAVLALVTILVGRVALSDMAHRRIKATKKD